MEFRTCRDWETEVQAAFESLARNREVGTGALPRARSEAPIMDEWCSHGFIYR
jgi:hypothetical protein